MKEEGIVKSVSESLCEVSVKRKSACGDNCADCSAVCTAAEHICVCKNAAGAKTGETVIIESDAKIIFKAAFLAYIFPLFCFIIPYIILSMCACSAAMSVFAALLCTAFAVLFSVLYSKKHKNDFLPSVTEILTSL